MSNSINDKDVDMICGCGKEARYVVKGEGSCNKYRRCLSYEELKDNLNQVERKLFAIKQILKD